MPKGGARPGAGRPRKNEGRFVEFTPEQLKELLESSYISNISRRSVSYTHEFKELFWQRYCDGADSMQIFRDAGLNVQILGQDRIYAFVKALRNLKERGLPFLEGNEPHDDKPEKKFDFPKPPRMQRYKDTTISPDEMSKMYHQVAYMSQEIEFIKKIILAGKDGKLK
jgi:hypothetical protein